MQATNWLSYVGMATGIIGAITGVAGAIVSYVSYRKIHTLKSLDLRLELRNAVNDLHRSISDLNLLIAHANASREAVAAARGYFRSGRMEKWKMEVEADKTKLAQLAKDAPTPEDHYEKLDALELESKLVFVHKLQGSVNSLRQKYESALRSDDEERKQVGEDARAQRKKI